MGIFTTDISHRNAHILALCHSPSDYLLRDSGLFIFSLVFLNRSGRWVLPNKHSFSVFLVWMVAPVGPRETATFLQRGRRGRRTSRKATQALNRPGFLNRKQMRALFSPLLIWSQVWLRVRLGPSGSVPLAVGRKWEGPRVVLGPFQTEERRPTAWWEKRYFFLCF